VHSVAEYFYVGVSDRIIQGIYILVFEKKEVQPCEKINSDMLYLSNLFILSGRRYVILRKQVTDCTWL
jgi:hypothetical protein